MSTTTRTLRALLMLGLATQITTLEGACTPTPDQICTLIGQVHETGNPLKDTLNKTLSLPTQAEFGQRLKIAQEANLPWLVTDTHKMGCQETWLQKHPPLNFAKQMLWRKETGILVAGIVIGNVLSKKSPAKHTP